MKNRDLSLAHRASEKRRPSEPGIAWTRAVRKLTGSHKRVDQAVRVALAGRSRIDVLSVRIGRQLRLSMRRTSRTVTLLATTVLYALLADVGLVQLNAVLGQHLAEPRQRLLNRFAGDRVLSLKRHIGGAVFDRDLDTQWTELGGCQANLGGLQSITRHEL